MKLIAPTLLAYAAADETSLMQERLRSSSKLATAESSRQDSTSKLLDTAVNMIKNGVTPDVITFVDATNQDINEEVLVAIQSEHDIDQAYIDNLCQDFLNAVQALEDQAAAIEVHGSNSASAQHAHHSCRADEAYACANSRRCEEQLRQKWATVKHEESEMREIHSHIHEEWCIHPPGFGEIHEWLDHPFNWAQTSPYPLLELPQDVRDFRHVSVTHFTEYMAQKIKVERAWLEYNEKLEECAELEVVWEGKMPDCDEAQRTARDHACNHATLNRNARKQFGQEWNRITALFEQARITKTANEANRKNEWETLKIVQCLLDHVHSSVVTSIETGAPCPTIDSDPDGVTLAIEDCHIVTRGCGEDSMTAHLCLNWCDEPPVPPLPPVEEPACTPMYVANEQSGFLAAIRTEYSTNLAANADYPQDLLTEYDTVLSDAGWAGCAPPLVCIDCEGQEVTQPCVEHTDGAYTCHLHEEYLSAGQSNQDTFRCLDGTCLSQAGRCNGHSNCADGSDEEGCDADEHLFIPAYLTQQFTCPADKHDDVHFTCTNGQCIDKVGLCNGVSNCADGSDEVHCNGELDLTLEAKSGRTITVESLESGTGVFHDRDYNFDSLGSFMGKTFIKYSNDDKMISYDHVMTKIRTLEPVTVFIAMFDHHQPSWLAAQGYTPSDKTGPTFSGVRETRHKEWDPSLLTTDRFDYSVVYSKVYEAGTISIPGNNGGDGSFLIFLDRPNAEDEYDARISAYWESGNCGTMGNDWNWGWCGNTAGNCPTMVETQYCASGEAELVAFSGTGAANSYSRDGCNYFYHAQYRCIPVPETLGEDLFIGCFIDDGARDLGDMVGNRDDATTNTFALCREACGDHTYMSLQFGGECFCSNSYGNGPQYTQVNEGECNTEHGACHGNAYNCGGTWRQAIYQINNFDHYEMIAHQDASSGAWFASSAKSTFLQNQNDPSAAAFMNIGQLAQRDFLNNGAYQFKIVYTGVNEQHAPANDGAPLSDATQEFEWTQTSWLTDAAMSGYSAISTNGLDTSPTVGAEFSGLHPSTNSRSVLDGSHDHDYWFHSVGAVEGFNNGIPAFKGGVAEAMSLYVKRTSEDTITNCNTPGFYGNDGHNNQGTADGASAIQFIDLGSGPLTGTGTFDAVTFHVSREHQDGLKFQIYRLVGGNVYKLVSESQALPSMTTITQHNLVPSLAYQDGDYIGWVHEGQGTFPFTSPGTTDGSNLVLWKYGIEPVGSDINFDGQGERMYGYRATLMQC
jgi:hypothetical protein